MQRVLRGDFEVCLGSDGKLYFRSKVGLPIKEPISLIDAAILSLYDGYREEAVVKAMSKELCGRTARDSMRYEAVQNFYGHLLLPVTSELLRETGVTFIDKRIISGAKFCQTSIFRRAMPVSMVWAVTSKCTRKCRYCYLSGKMNKCNEQDCIKLCEVADIARECFRIGVKEITFTGGDPLMRKDIYEAIVLFTRYLIQVKVFTKMRLIEERLMLLNKCNLLFCFSLDSHIPEVADDLAGYTGHYADMVYNFELCEKYNIPFSIHITVTALNLEGICETLIWAQKFAPQSIEVAKYDTDYYYNPSLAIASEVYQEMKEECSDFCREHQYNVSFADAVDKMLSCDIGRSKMVFDYKGKVVYCDKLALSGYFGDLTKESILHVWNSEEYKSMNVNPKRAYFKDTVCEKCKYFDECISKTGCNVKTKLRLNRIFAPLPEVTRLCGHSEKG